MNDTLTFEKLAHAICLLYGFSGEHLREFRDQDNLFVNHPDFNTDVEYDADFSDPEFQDLQGLPHNVSAKTYLLSDYFAHHDTISFAYDFGENWRFTITKQKVQDEKLENDIKVISGSGSYLIEDSWWPEGLRGHLDNYARQERDPDGRETREDFVERIQPAMRQFDIHKYQ